MGNREEQMGEEVMDELSLYKTKNIKREASSEGGRGIEVGKK